MSTPTPPRVVSVRVYPLKSAGGIDLTEASVEHDGLAHDRRWMIVDAAGRFVSQRTHSRMALLRTELTDDALRVGAPGMDALELPLSRAVTPGVGHEEVPVWGLGRYAESCGPEAAAWASSFLGVPCRVLRALAPPDQTALDARGRIRSGFADGYPALVISTTSLADLNARLTEPLPMDRFRPNLVVEGVPPYSEDAWRRVRIGQLTLLGPKPCTRCVTTTTNQETGRRGVEPLRTLARYRRDPDGKVRFGMNVGFEHAGTVRVGDRVRVEEAAS